MRYVIWDTRYVFVIFLDRSGEMVYNAKAMSKYFFIFVLLLLPFLFFYSRFEENRAFKQNFDVEKTFTTGDSGNTARNAVQSFSFTSKIPDAPAVSDPAISVPPKTMLNHTKTSVPATPPILSSANLTSAGSSTILEDVPFTSQAPFGEWSDPRQENGCEEASALMAVKWARGESDLSKTEAEQTILDASNWEEKTYGDYHDTSAKDTAERIFKGYFHYDNIEVKYNISANDIVHELQGGNLVIVPMDGQLLNDPYYTAPGPDMHMILVIGYNPVAKEFITNDPGTERGERYRYPENVFYNAIRDYPTGDHESIVGVKKDMIVVSK